MDTLNIDPDKEFTPSGTPLRALAPQEKPREKAMHHGMESLTDAELLALLLGTGVHGKSVIDLSREILSDCDGQLRRLSHMSVAELKKKYRGIGTAKATLLVAAMAFGSRVQASFAIEDPQMRSSEAVYAYMRQRLQSLPYEEFWVLHLSRANRVITADRISKGGLSATTVDVKLIAKGAIDNLSSAIILVHNHPSGTLSPSAADDALTRKVVDVCKILDIPVQDHVIITPSAYYSYRDEGRI